MDLDSCTARLCVEGTQAECERRIDDARRLFLAAWGARSNDYDAAMAVHWADGASGRHGAWARSGGCARPDRRTS
jgi:hypothetical protein